MSALKQPEHTYLLVKKKAVVNRIASWNAKVLSTDESIRETLASCHAGALWVSASEALTNVLARNLLVHVNPQSKLLLLHEPRLEVLPALSHQFGNVVFCVGDGYLPFEELIEVLNSPSRQDLFIGGTVDKTSRTLNLVRGDLSSLTVPLSALKPSGTGVKPDFDDFSVTDYGHTVKLGEYEAAADALLYEFDADYRTRIKKERQAKDKTFGASFRRLRKQRGLRRTDFPPFNEKTIARIEREEVSSIRKSTLNSLAKKLGVKPEEIETF